MLTLARAMQGGAIRIQDDARARQYGAIEQKRRSSGSFSVTVEGTYFEGNTVVGTGGIGDNIYNWGEIVTCPSTCPLNTTGTCTKMSDDECHGFEAECNCYSCMCS